jgi:hypothetical protein
MEGGLYKYPMNKYIKDGKVLDHLGLRSKVLHGPLTDSSATPYCGLEAQKPTKALKSVKGPGNTFDLSPKWSRTLPSLIYLFMGYL